MFLGSIRESVLTLETLLKVFERYNYKLSSISGPELTLTM